MIDTTIQEFSKRFLALERLFGFQEEAVKLLLEGENVVLRAPTGSGKTVVPILAYTYSKENHYELWDRLIYVVPLRSLASAQYNEYGKFLSNYGASIQIGGESRDEKFEQNVIFCTIDQLLGGYLTLPIGISERQSNIRAGALIGSLIVFDEIHLLEPDKSLATAIHLGKTLKGCASFLIMTATLSKALLNFIASKFNARIVEPQEKELQDIPSQKNKHREYIWQDKKLSASEIEPNSIVVCNTVQKAQEIYTELKEKYKNDIDLILLHSQFYKFHRKEKEDKLRRIFGKGSESKAKDAILVATQVIEVGLDISAERLYTELSPANSLIQRAGRCARWENSSGKVFVYPAFDREGNKNYHPYDDILNADMEARIVDFLKAYQAMNFTYQKELDFIEKTLGDYEKEILENFPNLEHKILSCWYSGKLHHARELIRDIDAISLILADQPEKIDWNKNPQTFSIPTNTVLGRLKEKFAPGVIKGYREKFDESTGNIEVKWEPIEELNKIKSEALIAIPSTLASYSQDIGLILGIPSDKPAEIIYEMKNKEKITFKYQTEYLDDHRARTKAEGKNLINDNPVSLKKISKSVGIDENTIIRIMELLFEHHDDGKLSEKWQTQAKNYLQKIGQKFDPTRALAHLQSEEKENEKTEKVYLPPHSAPGAIYLRKNNNFVKKFKDITENLPDEKKRALICAFLMAILSHHTGHPQFEKKEEPLRINSLEIEPSHYSDLKNFIENCRNEDITVMLLYFYMVRYLRLADQKATEKIGG